MCDSINFANEYFSEETKEDSFQWMELFMETCLPWWHSWYQQVKPDDINLGYAQSNILWVPDELNW